MGTSSPRLRAAWVGNRSIYHNARTDLSILCHAAEAALAGRKSDLSTEYSWYTCLPHLARACAHEQLVLWIFFRIFGRLRSVGLVSSSMIERWDPTTPGSSLPGGFSRTIVGRAEGRLRSADDPLLLHLADPDLTPPTV